jgi:hypothetical protein
MEDLRNFQAAHPELCEVEAATLPGSRGDARPLDAQSVATDALFEEFAAEPERDPSTLAEMLREGPDAVAWYHSFRLDPEGFGVYVDRGRVAGMKAEYHRMIWRDLANYVDAPVDDVLPMVEYSLVLDMVLAHAKFHHLVDYATAMRELDDDKARYGPYRRRLVEFKANPPKDPRFVVDIEEALGTLEGFMNYMNPTYGENVAKVVEGRVDDKNLQEWRAFFVGGRFATEIANAFSRQPPGYRDFTKFVHRTAKVGAFNYIRVLYAMNRQLQEEGQMELCWRIDGGEYRLVENTQYDNFLKVEPPDPPLYVV